MRRFILLCLGLVFLNGIQSLCLPSYARSDDEMALELYNPNNGSEENIAPPPGFHYTGINNVYVAVFAKDHHDFQTIRLVMSNYRVDSFFLENIQAANIFTKNNYRIRSNCNGELNSWEDCFYEFEGMLEDFLTSDSAFRVTYRQDGRQRKKNIRPGFSFVLLEPDKVVYNFSKEHVISFKSIFLDEVLIHGAMVCNGMVNEGNYNSETKCEPCAIDAKQELEKEQPFWLDPDQEAYIIIPAQIDKSLSYARTIILGYSEDDGDIKKIGIYLYNGA